MIQFLDVLFLIALAIIVGAEIKRGFSVALFDFLALYAALVLAGTASPMLAQHAGFSPDYRMNAGWSFVVCFAAFSAIALAAAKRLDRALRLNVGVMTAPLSALAGFAVAAVVLHGAAYAVSLLGGQSLSESAVGEEALNFSTYHNIVAGFSSLNQHPGTLASG